MMDRLRKFLHTKVTWGDLLLIFVAYVLTSLGVNVVGGIIEGDDAPPPQRIIVEHEYPEQHEQH